MRKNKIVLGLLAFALLSLSSCHRGIGCPSDFSIDLGEFVSTVITILPF